MLCRAASRAVLPGLESYYYIMQQPLQHPLQTYRSTQDHLDAGNQECGPSPRRLLILPMVLLPIEALVPTTRETAYTPVVII